MKYEYPHTFAELDANEWEEISQERADELLEALPPIRMKANAFMFGECLCHLRTGQPVYDAVVTVNNKHYTRPMLLAHFDPTLFTHQVSRQTNTPAWVLIERRAGYFIWRNDSPHEPKPYYQVTQTEEPPTTDAGYYSYAALLRAKGMIPSEIPGLQYLGF